MREHPKSMILPHCWICGGAFTDTGGVLNRHEHHIIPQAFGGTDGPEVSLCDGHHNMIHKAALAIVANDVDRYAAQIDRTLDDVGKKRAGYLSKCIARAQVAMRNDANKVTHASLTVGRPERLMLNALKSKLGGSNEAVLRQALKTLYVQHFPRRR